jgi:hypothetical protein
MGCDPNRRSGDARTSAYVASLGHTHARPDERSTVPIKASLLLITVSWVQSAFLTILSDECDDIAEFAEQAAAWNKRLLLHLDLLLAVYASTERSAHWY